MKTSLKGDLPSPIDERTAQEYLEKLAQESPEVVRKRREARKRFFQETVASYEASKKSKPQS